MGTPLTQWLQLVGWVLLATTLICLSATGMLAPLVADQPMLVNGLLLPADDPRAFLQLETLVSNWLVRTAELIGAELLDACGDWPELRRYLLRDPLLATRELDRLRNRLNTQLRWADWVERPFSSTKASAPCFSCAPVASNRCC